MKNIHAYYFFLFALLGIAGPTLAFENVTSSTPYTVGASVSGSFAGASNSLISYRSTYQGATATENGVERVYSFNLDKPQFLNLALGDSQPYHIYILNGTNTYTWQEIHNVGSVQYRLRFEAGTHYIVVEKASAANNSFTFQLTAQRSARVDGYPIAPLALTCGQNVTVDFASASNNISGYSTYRPGQSGNNNSDFFYEGGPDKQYKFTLATGKYVLLRPLTVQSKFHLYLLTDSSNGLVAYPQNQNQIVTYADYHQYKPFFYNTYLPAGTYYVSAELNNEYLYNFPATDASAAAPYQFTFQCSDTQFPQYQNIGIANTFTPGQLLQGNLANAPNTAYNYYDLYNAQFGPERGYAYQLASTSRFVAKPVAGREGNVHILPVGTPNSGNAEQASGTITNDGSTYSAIKPPGTYYLVIEQGSATAATNYSIQTQAFCIPAQQGSTTLNELDGATVNGTYLPGASTQGPYVYIPDTYTFTTPYITLDAAAPFSWQTPAPGNSQIYIDFNDDGDFADAGEQVYSSASASASVSSSFTLSSSNASYAAAIGKQVTMRIRVNQESLAGQPCAAGSGVTRDFPVQIYAYNAPYNITFNPTHGAANTLVAVGMTFPNSFSPIESVEFNGYATGPINPNQNPVYVYVPTYATTGPITVHTRGGSSTSSTNFVVDPSPIIASITSPACSGDSITITGHYFTNVKSATDYYFNYYSYTALQFRILNDSIIRVLLPQTLSPGSNSHTIVLALQSGTGQSSGQYYLKPGVTISSVTPLSGIGGNSPTVFTANGSGFSNGGSNAPNISVGGISAHAYPSNGGTYADNQADFTFPTGAQGPLKISNGYCSATGPVLTITAPYSTAQTVWARQGGGAGADRFNRTRTDVYGNVYAAGAFSGTATFDGLASAPPASGVLTATSYGGLDGVLTRYNKKGQLQWLVRFAGQAGDDEALGLATDKFGYAYVSGYFTGTMVIVPGVGSVNKTLVSAGGRDMFVAKIKSDGTIVYAFRMGDTGDDQATGVDVAPDLRFYVSGSFRGNTAIGGISGTVVPLTSRGNYDAFLAKFSDIGTLYWAIQGGGTGNDFGYGAAADIDGGGYLLGSFEGNARFNSQPTAGVSVTDNAVGGSDGFILAVTQQGGIRWFRSYGGATNENVRDVAPDPLGDGVAAVGGFSQSADFDGSSSTSNAATTLAARGFYDAFALRVDKKGNTKWVTKAGGYGQDQAYGVRMDRKGNVNVALAFTQTARNFGSAGDDLHANGTTSAPDGLIVRLAPATGVATGSLVQITTNGDDYALAVDTADGDAIIGAGSFSNNGSLPLGSRTLVSAGGQDGWLARFGTATSGSLREGLDETAIVESTADANVKLLAYPNPATGSLTLQLQGAGDGLHTATLYSADGKEAAIQTIEGNSLSVGASLKLPATPGLYLLLLAGPAGVHSLRVTVK